MGWPNRTGIVVAAASAGAIVASCEAIAVLASAPVERGIVAPAVAAAVALEVALAAATGFVVALVFRSEAARAATALAIGTASATLFVLSNGFLPGVSARATPALALAVAAAVGLVIAPGARWCRDGSSPALAGALLVLAAATARITHHEPGYALAAVLVLALPLAMRIAVPQWAPLILAAALALGALAGADRAPDVATRGAGRPDVLLVVIDTVRADAAPAPPGARFPTPELMRLAGEGTHYVQAFSTSCWTVPAHASLFTGLTSRAHRTGWESPHLTESPATLAEVFSRAGYRTSGFSANPWISPEFGFDRGFERFHTVSSADRPLAPWPVRIAPWLFARWDATLPFDDKGGAALSAHALRFLAREDRRPAFAFLNLLEAHMPYAPPERYLRGLDRAALLGVPQVPLAGLSPETEPTARALDAMKLLYAAEVAYDDALLSRLLSPLRAAGRLDDTVVIVVSDHGENLGDHPPLDHQLGLWDSLVHVPLIVRYPRRVVAGATESALVSLVDVHGALLALAGIGGGDPLPPRETVTMAYDRPGEILDKIRADLGLDPRPWDRRLDGVRSAGAKWIEGSDGARYAFDLAADPGERRNLAETSVPEAFVPLYESLEAWIAATPAADAVPAKLTDEQRRRLRSLGYVH